MIDIQRYCDVCCKPIKGEHYKIRHIAYINRWKPVWIDICGDCMRKVVEAAESEGEG